VCLWTTNASSRRTIPVWSTYYASSCALIPCPMFSCHSTPLRLHILVSVQHSEPCNVVGLTATPTELAFQPHLLFVYTAARGVEQRDHRTRRWDGYGIRERNRCVCKPRTRRRAERYRFVVGLRSVVYSWERPSERPYSRCTRTEITPGERIANSVSIRNL